MRICRFDGDTGPQYGLIEDGTVFGMTGSPLQGDFERGPAAGALEAVTLLSPVVPGKVICVGRNYAAHIEEMGREALPEPLVFYKPPSSVIGPGAPIELLPEMGRVEHEAELAAVIGRRGRFISEADALEHVFGYTCANDVTDRDFQNGDKQWWRAKGYDTFCPVGPWIETDLDADNVAITCEVNGIPRQEARTGLMLFPVRRLIAFISRAITLEPGDLILTGTPAGVSPLADGDTVTVTIEGIGSLSSPVVFRDL
ncbi:MAG: fumarylacetoacetate hydrolase family protein [Chloroflexi bacterium]|nr:fumarylacetoacetate hydrolase family protein [Chloroflexota bacterium]